MLKKKLKKAISIFQWLLTAVLVSVVLLLIFTTFNPVKSFQIFRVMSGSMEPKIKVGSVVFVQKVKPEILKEGNIITFTSREDPNITITHRLVAIEKKEGQTVFKTRGDANNSDDITETLPGQIKGKVVFSLPFLGYLSVFIRKPLGFGLLVILPALLIIISEILNIKKAIEKEVEKKYADAKDAKKEEPKTSKGKKFKSSSLLIFFLLGIGLFQIKPTNAYFSDVIVIGGNTFSMADTWPSPPPSSPGSANSPLGTLSTSSPSSSLAIVINEILPDPVGLDDAAKPNGEWVELYNKSDLIISVASWYLTDADGHSVLITGARTNTGGTDIAGNGFLVIYTGTSSLTLNNSGDTVNLYSGSVNLGNLIDSHTYTGPVPEGKSIARYPDGTDNWFDPIPSPGRPNQLEPRLELIPTPTVTPTVPTPTPTPTVAEKCTPNLDFSYQEQKRVSFVVSCASEYSKANYELVYEGPFGEKGIVGSVDNVPASEKIEKSGIKLGTCSSLGEVCVYDEGVKKITLKITLLDSSGGSFNLEKEQNY